MAAFQSNCLNSAGLPKAVSPIVNARRTGPAEVTLFLATEARPLELMIGRTSAVDLVMPKVDAVIPKNVIRYTVLMPPIALNYCFSKSMPFARE